jgi:tRNA-modifying protein YgfZ
VAKVHNLGHPPRRIVLLHLDGSGGELPEPGSVVSLGEKTVGHITRAVRHFEWGPIALALVKRMSDTEAELQVAGPDGPIVATQEVLVPQDAGATRREAIRRKRSGG